MQIIIVLLILFQVFSVSCDQLIQAQILFRHGSRNQIFKNWNYEQYQNISGYLTPIGMRQHYVLGQWLKFRYINNSNTSYNILNSTLNQNEIIIRSTDVNRKFRTIQSAFSNLFGLYPPETGFELPNNVDKSMFLPPNPNLIVPEIGLNSTPYLYSPVPIHIQPERTDYILLPFRNDACPNSAQLQASNKQSPMYKDVENKSQNLIKQYGKEMNMNDIEINNMTLETLMQAEDTRTVYKSNGYPKPEGITNDTLNQMDDLYALQLNMVFFLNQEQANMLSTPFFQEILANMEQKLSSAQNVKSYKFHMYSGHDTSIQLVLNALQLTSSECLYQAWIKSEVTNKNCILNYPGYASNIIFELWNDTQNVPYVKIMYNGTYFPPCVGSEEKNCTYEAFKKQMTSQFMDYNAGCGIITQTTEIKAPSWAIFLIVLMFIIFATSLGLGVSYYYKYKQTVSERKFQLLR